MFCYLFIVSFCSFVLSVCCAFLVVIFSFLSRSYMFVVCLLLVLCVRDEVYILSLPLYLPLFPFRYPLYFLSNTYPDITIQSCVYFRIPPSSSVISSHIISVSKDSSEMRPLPRLSLQSFRRSLLTSVAQRPLMTFSSGSLVSPPLRLSRFASHSPLGSSVVFSLSV